jgi:hypothetical protein
VASESRAAAEAFAVRLEDVDEAGERPTVAEAKPVDAERHTGERAEPRLALVACSKA